MRTLSAILAGCILICGTGCQNEDERILLEEKVKVLEQEKQDLTHRIEQATSENQQLEEQLNVLAKLPDNTKGTNLYTVQTIKISRITNFYDKDEDGKKEKLIVYIQPIDKQGDVLKVGGVVDVQLWDLNKEDGQAKLGQWTAQPDELKQLWFSTVIGSNYRLIFDVGPEIGESKDPLTIKVTFTDCLSGNVFKEQKVIKSQSE